MQRVLVAGLLAVSLAGCGAASNAPSPPPPPPPVMAEAAPMDAMVAPGEGQRAEFAAKSAGEPTPTGETASSPQTPAGAVLLAYTYSTQLEAPARAVPALLKAHQDGCTAAGPSVCQVLGASTNAIGEDEVSGTLNLRADPKWLAAFRAKLEGDAKAAKGKLVGQSVSTEDLTRAITDTDATLKSRKTLRDRLIGLLATRDGKLSDLLEIERELARVQGEIDSYESNLAVMRGRVTMSDLTVNYTSESAPVTGGTFSPITNALTGFMGTVASGIGAIIALIALVLPWLVIVVPAVWFGLRWRAQRAGGKKNAALTASDDGRPA